MDRDSLIPAAEILADREVRRSRRVAWGAAFLRHMQALAEGAPMPMAMAPRIPAPPRKRYVLIKPEHNILVPASFEERTR